MTTLILSIVVSVFAFGLIRFVWEYKKALRELEETEDYEEEHYDR